MAPDSNMERTEKPFAPNDPARKSSPRSAVWKFVIPLALAGGLVWGGIAVFSGALGADRADGSRGALSYQVSRNPLQVTVVADGNLESASNIEVKCRVAGGGTILWIVEDGKVVEEGEEIVKLDTSAIDDKLNSQRIVYEKALATQIQAQEDLEAAKISVKEYEEGTYIALLKQYEAEIQIALENLRSAENQLQYTKKMVRKGFVSSLQREADEFAVERGKLDLDAATTRKNVLVEFTKLKTLRDLVAKREAASAKLRSEQAGLQLEKARLDRLQDQLKNCVITAPNKGMVVYANESSRGGGSRFGSSSQQGTIEEGAMVRESQALVRLPDLARMQVKVTVHESRVEQIKAGLPARIVIQDQEYTGRVLRIANQPSQSSWSSANVKEYPTVVSIDGESTGLRPGMSAKVTILVAMLNDALTVPVSSVVEQRGGFFCWVKSTQGPQRRPLKLGHTNDKLIEVVDGVKEGDEVLRNPRAVVEEAREEEPFEKQARDVKFAAGGVDPTNAPGPATAGQAAADPASREELSSKSEPPVAGVPSAATARLPGAEPRGDSKGEGKPGGSGKRGGRGSMDLMQYDKDGDKKVSREEVPERMQEFFDRMDPNGDGFIDESEVTEMRKRRPSGGGRPGGSGGEGSRGDGAGGEGGGGDRPGGP